MQGKGNSASEITWSGTCIPERRVVCLEVGQWSVSHHTWLSSISRHRSRRRTLTMQASLLHGFVPSPRLLSVLSVAPNKKSKEDDDCPTDAMKCNYCMILAIIYLNEPERARTMQARKQQTRSQGEQTKNRRDDDDALEDQQRTPPRRPTSRRWGSCSPAARRRRAGIVGAGCWSRLPRRSAPPRQRPRRPARGTR